MESQHTPEYILNSEVFKIPIEEFEKDLEAETAKEKKKEILELFRNNNNLHSGYDFNNIKSRLHKACRNGDIDLIKIYLSETIYFNKYKIDKTNRTASLFDLCLFGRDLIVPRAIEHESVEYLITSISGISNNIKTIKFVEDSAVKTIHNYSFDSYSKIREIHFPNSLEKLNDGWCNDLHSLKITISPSNGHFILKDDKYLLGKSDPNNDDFDILLFANRDIKEICIPSNIKIISPYAFEQCRSLSKVEIPPNSSLQTIGKFAFHITQIKEFFIPSTVLKIGEYGLSIYNLTKVDFSPNTNLQTIEKGAFSSAQIDEIFIPSTVLKIGEYAFENCFNLKKVEIPLNSNLQTIEMGAFFSSPIKEIYFPSSLKELKKGWCYGATCLTKIIVSPSNHQFIFKDDKYLLGKSDPNKEDFDILLFANRDIKEICIPSNIKIISSYAFEQCRKLTKVEIPPNSNLHTIEEYAFAKSEIEAIFIPSTVLKICGHAFYDCIHLAKVEIPANSHLQIIEECAFTSTQINHIFIPSTVLKICESGLLDCQKLTKIDIPTNSNLQTIEKDAFCSTRIKDIFIPSTVVKIGENAFRQCYNLRKVEFSPNSNLQTIEACAFFESQIDEIFVPSTVLKIGEYAFEKCFNLKKVEIPPHSNLQTIEACAFFGSSIKEIYFPSSLKELKKGWCFGTTCLTKIIVSPFNDQFIFKDDKYLLGKSDPNKEEFDILLFANRDIKEIRIPSNIKIISSYAFEQCRKLTKVEIAPNSNLHTIEEYAFTKSPIEAIFIPSKVSKIDSYAFEKCPNIIIVEISEESKLESFPQRAFENSESNLLIMIPPSLKELIH